MKKLTKVTVLSGLTILETLLALFIISIIILVLSRFHILAFKNAKEEIKNSKILYQELKAIKQYEQKGILFPLPVTKNKNLLIYKSNLGFEGVLLAK